MPAPASAVSYRRRRLFALGALLVAVLAVVLVARGSGSHTGPAATDGHGTAHGGPTAARRGSRRSLPAGPSLAGVPVDRWLTLSSSLLSRGEVSAARVGNYAYVVGGFSAASGGQSSAAVERLDLRSGHWSTSSPLPRPLNHMSTGSYAGNLYVVGGYSQSADTSAGAVRSFWRFSPATGHWTQMPDAPVARAAAGAAVIDHRLYVAGGRNDSTTTLSSLAVFDFDSGQWSLGPPLLHAREHVAAAAAGGVLYLLGGRALGQGNFADSESYRPGDSAWQRVAPMPMARAGFQAVEAGGRVVVVGGEGPAGTIGQVDALDPASGRWRQLASLPTPRHGLGLVADGSLVWAMEGGPQPGLTTSRALQRLRAP